MKKSLIALAVVAVAFSACTKSTVERDDGDILEVKEYNTTLGTKNLVDPVHGKRTSLWYGAVLGVNDTNANGIAYVHRFEDGASVLTVNLNILQAGAGEYFSVGIKNAVGVEKDGGKLTSIIGDARHSARMELAENLDGFTTVVVYKNVSGTKTLVAEGLMKLAP
jgi:hypothetical protein